MTSESALWEIKIQQLKKQNANFKKLLASTLKVAQLAPSAQFSNGDDEFIKETIRAIETEKADLEKNLSALNAEISISVQTDTVKKIAEIEMENNELKVKLQQILKQTFKEEEEIRQLQIEHNNLLEMLKTQKNADVGQILGVDSHYNIEEGINLRLFEERIKLHQKLFNLKASKIKLVTDLEKCIKSESEVDLNKCICCVDSVASVRSVNEMNCEKIKKLEDERAIIVKELQILVDCSRDQITDEYTKLLNLVTKLENERISLKNSLNSVVDTITNPSKNFAGNCTCLQELEAVWDKNKNVYEDQIKIVF